MDIRTGKIYPTTNELKKAIENLETKEQDLLKVTKEEMTDKQKETNQVSLHDNKSVLGKKLQKVRKKLGYSQMSRNQKRNLRKRLKK